MEGLALCLTVGPDYIRGFHFFYRHIKYQLLYMLKIKLAIKQQDLKATSILSNLNIFHSLKILDRVSQTELQVGENSNLLNLAVKGLN